MKWFKHISDSLDDPFVFDLINKFGGDGYLCFFGILEIMSREFDVKTPGISQLSVRFMVVKLQLSRQKLMRILKFCEEKGRILSTLENDHITLNCPKLKMMCDEYTLRAIKKYRDKGGTKAGQTPKNVRPEVEVEVDKEEENKKDNVSGDFKTTGKIRDYHKDRMEYGQIVDNIMAHINKITGKRYNSKTFNSDNIYIALGNEYTEKELIDIADTKWKGTFEGRPDWMSPVTLYNPKKIGDYHEEASNPNIVLTEEERKSERLMVEMIADEKKYEEYEKGIASGHGKDVTPGT